MEKAWAVGEARGGIYLEPFRNPLLPKCILIDLTYFNNQEPSNAATGLPNRIHSGWEHMGTFYYGKNLPSGCLEPGRFSSRIFSPATSTK